MTRNDIPAPVTMPAPLPLRAGMLGIARTFLQPKRIARIEQVDGATIYVTTATAHWQVAVSIRPLTGSLGGMG